MSVFMARGYKDDPFHRHVARSLANYFREERVAELKQAVEVSNTKRQDELLELLESDTLTAWGAKSDKRHDRELYEQMEAGDYFIMRTGQPNVVQFVQQADFLLDASFPSQLRQSISDIIWTAPDYDLIWLSETPVLELELSEDEFEELIGEVIPGFEIADWFPSQGRNFTRIDDKVLQEFGGERDFLDRLAEYDGHLREPGVSNYFLLDASQTGANVETDRQYTFKQRTTDISSEVIDAENDARLIIHDGAAIIGTGRLGNIEGERRDGGIYKILNIIDWMPLTRLPLDELDDAIDVGGSIASQSLDGSVSTLQLPAITRVDADVWTTVEETTGTRTQEYVERPDEGTTETTTDETDGLHCSDPVSPTAPYYWVTHTGADEIDGEYLEAIDDEYWGHDLAKLEPGEQVFNYYGGEIIGYSEIEGVPFPVSVDDSTHCKVELSLTRFEEPVQLHSVLAELLTDERRLDDHYPVDGGGVTGDYLCNLSEAAGELLLEHAGVGDGPDESVALERLEERLELPKIIINLPEELYFDGGERARLQRQINAALNSGKHLIFTGPPGTGKSKLARHISEQATQLPPVDGFTFTTATAEWTTFDTIGGNVPEIDEDGREQLAFDPRLFLRSFRDNEEQIHNEWLVIDELNRADIDKAFGQLFSVLSRDSVALPYEREGRVRIDWVDQTTGDDELASIAASTDRFPVTPAWRLIGTMNTFDKTSLYELSYAFMRRFSFIHVGVPDLTLDAADSGDDEIIRRDLLNPTGGQSYATTWRSTHPELEEAIEEYHEEVAIIWHRINKQRTIGPSIVLDMFQHIAAFEGGDRDAALSSAIVSLVFPQLEGMRETEYKELLESLGDEGQIAAASGDTPTTIDPRVDMDYLRSKAADMFDVDI